MLVCCPGATHTRSLADPLQIKAGDAGLRCRKRPRHLDRVLQRNFHGGGCVPRRSFRSPDQRVFPLSFRPETVDEVNFDANFFGAQIQQNMSASICVNRQMLDLQHIRVSSSHHNVLHISRPLSRRDSYMFREIMP